MTSRWSRVRRQVRNRAMPAHWLSPAGPGDQRPKWPPRCLLRSLILPLFEVYMHVSRQPCDWLPSGRWIMCSNGGNQVHVWVTIIPVFLSSFSSSFWPQVADGPTEDLGLGGGSGKLHHPEEAHWAKPTHWTTLFARCDFGCIKPEFGAVRYLSEPFLVTQTWCVAIISYYRGSSHL